MMKHSLLVVLLVTICCYQVSSSPFNTSDTTEGNREEISAEEIDLLLLPSADSPSKLLSNNNNSSKPTHDEDKPKAIQKRSTSQPQPEKQGKPQQHDLEHAEGNLAFPPKFAKSRRIQRSVTKQEDPNVGGEHATIEEKAKGMEEEDGEESSLVFKPTFSKRN